MKFSHKQGPILVLETDGEDMQIRDHDCYFSAAHAAKDSGIALKLAQEAKIKLPLAAATKKQYDDDYGLGELTNPGSLNSPSRDAVNSARQQTTFHKKVGRPAARPFFLALDKALPTHS